MIKFLLETRRKAIKQISLLHCSKFLHPEIQQRVTLWFEDGLEDCYYDQTALFLANLCFPVRLRTPAWPASCCSALLCCSSSMQRGREMRNLNQWKWFWIDPPTFEGVAVSLDAGFNPLEQRIFTNKSTRIMLPLAAVTMPLEHLTMLHLSNWEPKLFKAGRWALGP